MLLRGNISADDCIRELFKPSKDSASLCVCNEKNVFGFEFWIFCEWCHKWSCLRPFWPTSYDPRAKLL